MASFRQTVLVVLATVLCVASHVEGQILFSKLPKSLIVTATMAGGGPITGNLNTSFILLSSFWDDRCRRLSQHHLFFHYSRKFLPGMPFIRVHRESLFSDQKFSFFSSL